MNASVTLDLNNTPFANKLVDSEQKMRRFAGVTSALNRDLSKGFEERFRRDPGRRAERAAGQFALSLSQGDVQSAIFGLTERMTGFGLAAGVAIGGAIGLFEHFKANIHETAKTTEDLRDAFSVPVSNLVKAYGVDELDKKIEEQKKALSAKEENATGFTKNFIDALKSPRSLLMGPTAGLLGAVGLTGLANKISPGSEKEKEDAKEYQEDQQKLFKLQDERGKKALRLANIQGDVLKLSRKDFELQELAARAEEEREKIKLKGLDKGRADELRAVDVKEKFGKDMIEKRSKAREVELDIARKLIDVENSNLPAAEKQKLKAGIELSGINKRLSSGLLTPEEKDSLKTEKYRREGELRGMSKGEQNPFAYGTSGARGWESQQEFARRDAQTNDPNAWGSLGARAVDLGQLPKPEEKSAGLVAAIKTAMDRSMEKYWGEGGKK